MRPSRICSRGARQHDLIFVPEYELETTAKERRYVDGALLHTLRVPFGYWEAKDEKDDLDAEIDVQVPPRLPAGQHHLRGLARGRPDPERQGGACAAACEDVAALEKLLDLFFGYERPEID